MVIPAKGVDVVGKEYELEPIPTTHNFIDLTGEVFEELTVIGYTGKSTWLCLCECENLKVIHGSSLKSGKTKSCGHDTSLFKDMTGQVINDIKVIRYLKNSKYECECSCGRTFKVRGQELRSGNTKSCGHDTNILIDISGMTFGELYVRRYVDNQQFECKCSCGIIRNINSDSLRFGKSKSCGHNTNIKKDITGKKINSWFVRSYITDKGILKEAGLSGTSLKLSWVLAECDCGRICIVNARDIRIGHSKSCGHCNQTDEQLEIVANKENFIKTLAFETARLNRKLYLDELVQPLGITKSAVCHYVNKYEAQTYVEYRRRTSAEEDQIAQFIKELLNTDIIRGDKEVLEGQELDIYLPEYNFAIEYNGDFWHSAFKRQKGYHQNKTILCARKGIRLLHIFEHEWKDEQTQIKLKSLIKQILNIDQQIIDVKDTKVCNILRTVANEFIKENSLYDSIESSINLGLYYNNKLIQVMTFNGIELSNFCTKHGYKILDNGKKLFDYYITNYMPNEIWADSDVTKFTGEEYEQLGMKFDSFADIKYIYINQSLNNKIKSDNSLQFIREQGWETDDTQIDEVMALHYYLKIYTCGDKHYTWHR